MVGIGFSTKATHLAVYDAPVGTYDKLSFRVHNFGERWLGVATRAKAALPHNSCLRPVWQRRLQIRGVTVPPLLPLSPLVSVLLLIGLAGCSKDRGELVLKKKPPFIDLDACEDNAPQAVTVRELAETTARLPINPSYGENDCPENLPIGEQDSGEILLVSAPRPALAFVTPSLPPMPIILPIDEMRPIAEMRPTDELPEDDVSGLHEVRQEPARPHVPAVSTPPKDNPIPTSSNEVSPSGTVSPIGNTPPAEDALPVGLIPSNREPILLGDITLSEDDDAAGEDGQPIERETPPDEEPEQISEAIPPPQVVQNVSHNPAQPPEDVIPPKDDPIPTSSNEVSPSGTVSPKDEMPEDEKPDRWDVRQDASLSLPKVIQPAPKNPALSPEGEIAEREPSPEREPVSPPPKENPEDGMAEDEKPEDGMAEDDMAEDEMPEQEEVGQNPSLPSPPGILVMPNPQIAERDPSPEREPVSPPTKEPKVIISPPRVIQPAPENSAPENSAPENSAPPPIDGAPPRGNTPPAEDSLPVGLIPSNREPILISDIRLSEDNDVAEDGQLPRRQIPSAEDALPADNDRALPNDETPLTDDDAAEDDAAEDDAAEDENDTNPPLALPIQNQMPVIGTGDHSGAATPLVILGSNHFDQPTIGSAHGNIIVLSTGGSVRYP